MDHKKGLDLIRRYFPHWTDQQLASLEAYVIALLKTNQNINLISRKNEEEVWVNHILHSLSIAKVLSPVAGQRVLDFGTGGGLPGIPLAIAFPEVKFHLVDSTGKKIQAVQEMVDHLKLDNVSLEQARVETLTGSYDFAVSRAVTALPKIDGWIKGLIQKGNDANLPNGLVYIKGGDFEDELIQIAKPYQVWELNDMFEDPFFETKKVVWIALAS